MENFYELHESENHLASKSLKQLCEFQILVLRNSAFVSQTYRNLTLNFVMKEIDSCFVMLNECDLQIKVGYFFGLLFFENSSPNLEKITTV